MSLSTITKRGQEPAMFAPTMDQETAAAVHRAITKAVHLINATKTKYVHHLIADVPPEFGT